MVRRVSISRIHPKASYTRFPVVGAIGEAGHITCLAVRARLFLAHILLIPAYRADTNMPIGEDPAVIAYSASGCFAGWASAKAGMAMQVL